MRRLLSVAGCPLAVASILAACGAAHVPDLVRAPARPAPPEALPAVPAVVAAHWAVRYVPGELSASAPIDGDRRIEAGPRGERWLTSRSGHTAAAVPLPERIESVVARGDEVEFVGASGTVYAAPPGDPLTAAVVPRSPPRPLAHVVTGKGAILGVDGADVVRTVDGGKTWTTRPTGVAPRVVGSIALSPRGVGAMLLQPQWSLVTDDDGATWSHIRYPASGIGAVRVTGERVLAAPLVSSAEGTELSGSPLRWTASPLAGEVAPSTPESPPPHFEYGSLDEHGGFAGRRWLEMLTDDSQPRLWAEDLEEKAPPVVVRAMPECEPYGTASIGASPDGGVIVVACGASGATGELALFRSRNGGQDWTGEGRLFATEDDLRVVVAPGGWTLITGACAGTRSCPLHATIGDERGYADTSSEGDAGTANRARLTSAAFSGANVVALAAVDEEPGYPPNAALESTDLGRTFRVRLRFDPGASEAVGSSLGAQGRLPPGLTGSVVRAQPGGSEPWSLQPVAQGLPASPERFSLSGAHGLATLPGRLFETTDGARTWTEIARVPLGDDDVVRCGPEACIVGATLRRIGWSEGAAPSLPIASGFPPAPPAALWSARPLATCRVAGAARLTLTGVSLFDYPVLEAGPALDQDGPWKAIVPVRAGDEVALTAVGVQRTARGTTYGSVKLATVHHGTEASVADISRAGAIVAVFPFKCSSCEGIVYHPGDPVRVAWTTAQDPRTVRQAAVKLASGENECLISVRVLDGGEALVSISTGSDDGGAGETLVVDGGRVKARYGTPASRILSVEGKPVAASMGWQDDLVVLRSLADRNARAAWRAPHWSGATWLGPPFGLESDGAVPVVWAESSGGVFLAPVQRVEPEPSAVVAIDTAPLVEALPPCSAATRSAARVHVRLPPTSQVLLEGDKEAVAMGVTGEVLRAGRDGRACVSVLAAREVHSVQGVPVPVTDVAAVYPDDMQHGVLSRTYAGGAMELLPLSCRAIHPATGR